MLLNSGDVPNLFPPDEKAELIDKVQNIVRLEVSLILVFEKCTLLFWSYGDILLANISS